MLYQLALSEKKASTYMGALKYSTNEDNIQVASTTIQNSLYILQTLDILPLAAVTYISVLASLKFWHRRLGYPSYINFKRFSNDQDIDIVK